jgi:hypothetical protein
MKSMNIMLIALILVASTAVAGEVYGTITDGGKPVPAGTKVEISISGKVESGETDKFGSYRIFVKAKGKCRLTVRVKDQSPSVDVFSYDKSSRYDWILEAKEDTLSLRRK